MQAITIDETPSGVTITNRSLPSVLQGVYSLAATIFFVFVLYKTLPDLLNGGGSWLPPLDRLPEEWKTTILAICLVAAFVIVLAPLAISLRTLFFAKVWRFDVLARIVTRNGEQVGMLDECQEVIVEGDFRGETDTIDLSTAHEGWSQDDDGAERRGRGGATPLPRGLERRFQIARKSRIERLPPRAGSPADKAPRGGRR